jgi:hypothetical protein
MHPTTAFAAPFEFVGWTISSPPSETLGCLPNSLYTFLRRVAPEAWLGITLLGDVGFPEFDRFHHGISPVTAPLHSSYSTARHGPNLDEQIGAGRSNH